MKFELVEDRDLGRFVLWSFRFLLLATSGFSEIFGVSIFRVRRRKTKRLDFQTSRFETMNDDPCIAWH